MQLQLSLRTAAIALIAPWPVVAMALVVLVGIDVGAGVALAAASVAIAGTFLGCMASLGFAYQSARFLSRARDALRQLPSAGDTHLHASLFIEQKDFASAFNTMAAQWRASRQALSHQAFHDPLTGLANRAAFMTGASEALSRANALESVAVLFVDLDRFKAVNDTLGHGVGDNLLSVVAARLTSAAGTGAMVARLGGDEFTILVSSHDAEARATGIAAEILRRLRRPVSVAGRELFVNASIGIAIGSNMLATELLRRADIALYRAKEAGKGRYFLFREADEDVAHDPVQLDTALRHATDRDELELVYQPEVELATGRIIGMEALLRWNHPHLGVLSPSQFIAMAEESGEIARLGQWALERACRDLFRLQQLVPGGKDLVVAVNLSASEFVDPELARRIALTVRQAGLAPSAVKLELTESILVRNVAQTAETLAALRAIGCRVAIDDFGTGYSSLSYLQAFAADTLKIDQSFVRRIGQDDRSGAIIEAVLDLSKALDLHVVAEGVETLEEAQYLHRVGCRAAQGHYFSEPIPISSLETLLRERAAAVRANTAA